MLRDRPGEIPSMPTPAECIHAILWSYKPEALDTVLKGHWRALGGKSPEELMDTVEGRRKVYGWALGLAEGVMG